MGLGGSRFLRWYSERASASRRHSAHRRFTVFSSDWEVGRARFMGS